ncbi:TonB-dependent receptor [Sphingobium lactosutens]|uniref:TonB-dependent receptor n=1 Tax=Sphingobium lactosutens TaxID=522773 RepID=UPI0015BB0A3B|nr:TonB-dependent receptor [Sphingobium lactosutens]NWK97003.1 TonB-dependent receptor [Sphingobium lactosutens]
MAFKPVALASASMFALMLSGAAHAQDAATAAPQSDEPADIVVTGVRASLATAQRIKQNSVQIVDSIVAQDIGKLPDNTVSDALQRVTGIQVTRAGGEAGTVLIRGLPNTATLLNGREAFTGTGRGIALQDIPAELLAGVDVYKTSTPDLVEGGVAGVIDVRLRRPFDFDGFQVAGGGRAVYSDQAGKWGYLGSALVSNRWDTSIGEIGIMLSASHNRRRYEDNTAFDFVSNPIADPNSGNQIGVPDTVGGLYTQGDRRRTAYNASVQWRPAANLEFYVDALYTQYKNRYDTDFFVGLPKAGNVTSITPNPDYPALANGVTVENAYTITSNQAYEDKTTTYQINGGVKYTTDDNTTLSSELTYNRSRLPNRNMIVDTSFNAPTAVYNFDKGGTPQIDIQGVDLTDPSAFTLRTLFDNHSVAVSRQWAWRGDVEHKFDDGFLSNFKIGARYTNRRVTSQATASIPIAATNPVLVSTLPGEFWDLSPNGLVKGRVGIGQFLDANGDYLLDNSDTVRGWFGQAVGDRPFEPNLAFFDLEKTYAFYAQAGYRFDLGSVPVDGVFGVRVVNTVTALTGNGVDSRQNYLNALPSINARFGLMDNLQLRLAAGKTITRPNFADLNPLVTYVPSGSTGNQGYAGTGGGGNPALTPIKSDAYDITLEYYPSRNSSITAAGFYRKIKGYIQTYSQPEEYLGDTWLVNRPRNTGSGSLKGVELAYQQFFDFLPGALSGLGAQLNGTYTIGKTEDPINGGKQRIVNVSKYSYNVVAIYEKYGISARLAYNWRSSFVDSYNSGGLQASTIVADPTGQLDFSASYDLTPAITLTFDATNITDRTYQDRFKGLNSLTGVYTDTPRDTRTYDRTFEFGARFRF